MADNLYHPPTFKSSGFNCVHCGAFADQGWGSPIFTLGSRQISAYDQYWACRCARCQKYSFWVDGALVYPSAKTAMEPNVDLPEDILSDYEEARSILNASPRGAAALLRLCIQKICKHLGQDGRNINADIGELVKQGLSQKIQRALDIVRVVGNNAVHPGQIDLRDDISTAQQLFGLINLISDAMISQPKQVDELYNKLLADEQREAIARRDSSPST